MKRFDKLKNIKKANILAEQRYKRRLIESTELDLMSLIGQKATGFSMEGSDFGNGKFKITLFNDKFDNLVVNDVNIDGIGVDVDGTYKMLSSGYYRPGRCYGPPEDCYPDESENPEFDVVINNIKIDRYDDGGDSATIMELSGSDIKKIPTNFIDVVENKVIDMLLDSGEFDPSNDSDYDGPDDDYDPSNADAREWGGIDW
jgi:hypothetical protein